MMQPNSCEHKPAIDFNSPALQRHQACRLLKERLAPWCVAVGGLGVILAITLVFFYLLYEVLPLFRGASFQQQAGYGADTPLPLYLDMDKNGVTALQLLPSGQLLFTEAQSGRLLHSQPLALPAGDRVSAVVGAGAGGGDNLLAIGLASGQLLLFRAQYPSASPARVAPALAYPYGTQPIELLPAGQTVSALAVSENDSTLLVAAAYGRRLALAAFSRTAAGFEPQVSLLDIPGVAGQMVISGDQSWLYLLMDDNRLAVIDISSPEHPRWQSTVRLAEAGETVTAMAQLSGGLSLITGDSGGHISQWLLTRQGANRALTRVRRFVLGDSPVAVIVAEAPGKSFLALDRLGQLGLFHATAGRRLARWQLADSAGSRLALAPGGGALLVGGGALWRYYRLDNDFPEVSWSALWDRIWYESYDQPEYIWQSSGAGEAFEPKFSLTPLAFGTLKAAFYAMVLAVPLALCAAVYTACFMAAALRRKIKPAIELMEALPTVILGFLAGTWLAPLLENHLVGIVLLMVGLPVILVFFGFFWDSLAGSVSRRLGDGSQALLLVPVVLVSAALAFALGSPLENALFNGDIQGWLSTRLGITYNQRNALVVGLAMGFAVIPTIFSIAEDAIFTVPRHLSYGSLALGATPWQTLTRVVLPSASPGIFSAVMIGMGRAVGETMIVLMATGNTPIMEANIFAGMRTLAANIAMEVPESEVGSSHYRILFLAALVLFLFTFVVNTVAEIIRSRLRRRYGGL